MSKIYSTQKAFEMYIYYLALKRHFTSNYDFFKYNGKVNANVMSFENRKDKFFFYKLSKLPHAKELIFANVLKKPDIWVGELVDNKATEVYNEYRRKKESLSYVFKQDLKKLKSDFDANLISQDGQHPFLLRLYLQEEITLETLTIIDMLTNCFKYWCKNISDNIVLPHINSSVQNYKPFMKVDKNKMRQIVVDEFKHNAI